MLTGNHDQSIGFTWLPSYLNKGGQHKLKIKYSKNIGGIEKFNKHSMYMTNYLNSKLYSANPNNWIDNFALGLL